MEFIKLKTLNDFYNLKKGDTIVVKWGDYFLSHTRNSKRIMIYEIFENRKEQTEIICQWEDNHFFNYKLHLYGKSSALEVYKVV